MDMLPKINKNWREKIELKTAESETNKKEGRKNNTQFDKYMQLSKFVFNNVAQILKE